MSKRGPPCPRLTDDTEYEDWKNDIAIWQMCTDCEADKMGATIYLNLEGKARRHCKGIKPDDLKGANGVVFLLNKLEQLFGKDEQVSALLAYEHFESFRRPEDMSVIDYINEFESRYAKAKDKKLTISDGVLAHRLLKSANISPEKQALVRATLSAVTLDEMKKKIKAIFDLSDTSEGASGGPSIKVEPVYHNSSHFGNSNSRYSSGSNTGFSNQKYHGESSRGFQNRNYRGNFNKSKKLNYNANRWRGKPADKQSKECYTCSSTLHIAKDCPHDSNSDFYKRGSFLVQADDEEEITLFSREICSTDYVKTFMDETENCAVLDSGCVNTVCGKSWLNKFMGDSDYCEGELPMEESNKMFRFGNGKSFKSKGKVDIPANLGSHKVKINADVVDLDIPLLMSRNTMKKAGTKLDFVNDRVNMLGEDIDLNFTSSGHYIIQLNKVLQDKNKSAVDEVFLSTENLPDVEKQRIALKLHKQFAHANCEKIINLLKDAGNNDTVLFKCVREVGETCEICMKHKPKKSHSVVGFSLAKDFNEVVSMDLKFIEGVPCLHLVDNATRLSSGAVLRSKHPKEVVEKLFMHWITIFGCPQRILSDNGREFNNAMMRELGDKVNTEVTSTAASSPWSNGLNEKHNAIIGAMATKVLAECKCSISVALAWSISAKNALENVFGFSPNQLVFGRNPNLPTVMNSNLPALEGVSSSQLIADHLNAMHAARKAFVVLEASEKLRRALKSRTRNASSVVEYETGMKVYYKLETADVWHGPAEVIGKACKQVYVKHGGVYYRVNPCNLTPAKPYIDKKATRSAESNQVDKSNGQSSSDDDFSDGEQQNEQNEPASDENSEQPANPTKANGNLPSLGSCVQYQYANSDHMKCGKILSKAGKSTGANRYWLNVEEDKGDGTKEQKSVDFYKLQSWSEMSDEVLLVESNEVVAAKQCELQNLKDHAVFHEVDFDNQPLIQVRWVVTEKCKDGITHTKARLVAKGFQDPSSADIRKDSPTCLRDSLHIALMLAANNGWRIRSLDVKCAFLQGKLIQRDVFLKPPREAKTDKVWKLEKTIYGLGDASRKWYLELKETLEMLGMVMSRYDEAVFYFQYDGALQGVIALHVDDFFHAGSDEFNAKIMVNVRTKFKISKEEELCFNYLGLQIEQFSDCIKVHQTSYITDLELIDVDKKLPKSEKLSNEKFRELRSLIGQLSWVANHTRADIAFDVCQLSVKLNNSTIADLSIANKCVKRLKGQVVCLKFPFLGDLRNASLLLFTDASYANLENCGSQGGSIVFLQGENGSTVPISWQSKKLKRVVRSTSGAETLALLDGIDNCVLIKTMLQEIFGSSIEFPIKARIDCKNLRDLIHSSKTVEDKHQKVGVCAIRDYLRQNVLAEVKWVETTNQLADALTKAGANVDKLSDALQGKHSF